ncbi:hypothetical protein [Paenibacillus wenxiniae]|uniref:DUF2612 domain-containing protein n=1 Tax=Paenibacillus wenxiniae TaxID=1636843 RepID=A0ABW4RKK7_9BACL
MISVAKILEKLTDVFAKRPDSTIGKLLTILSDKMGELEVTFNKIEEWRDIQKAKGATLDLIGSNVGQKRGAASDAVYRIMIQSKIARNLSKGDINTIIRVIALALSAQYSEIKILEKYEDEFDPEPAAISLIQMPIDKLNASGISLPQFIQIIQRTVAAGVRVSSVQLVGSFRFSDMADQTEENSNGGFGVGEFGYLFDPDDSPELPI